MPAYSFKERFVTMILTGKKNQTIRKKRKGQAKPGSILYLYYGLRTKWCRKLKEVICLCIEEIIITEKEAVFINGKKLTKNEKDLLAYNDGFRNEEINLPERYTGCFNIMFRWWNQTHKLPFKGDIIYW